MVKKIINFLKYVFSEDDVKSDILFLIFIFVIFLIVHIFCPYLFSVVMTKSMQHDNFNYEKYIKYNITPEEIMNWPFRNGINVGDVVIIVPVNPRDIKVGDVVLYKSIIRGIPILHRVVKKYYENGKLYFTVMGDNNPGPSIEEIKLPANRIIGKAIFRIPYLGLPKVWISQLIARLTGR